MESFSRPVPGMGESLVLPMNILEKWMARFESKFRRDPNFMMKN